MTAKNFPLDHLINLIHNIITMGFGLRDPIVPDGTMGIVFYKRLLLDFNLLCQLDKYFIMIYT